MIITIRRAEPSDAERVLVMLRQIGKIHESARPDIYRDNLCKHDIDSVGKLILQENDPVFVAVADGVVAGYVFCAVHERNDHPALRDSRVLWIDDLCVDEAFRGHSVGKSLMSYVADYAKSEDFDRVELNVWEFNGGAEKFYESCGFTTQRRIMELKVD